MTAFKKKLGAYSTLTFAMGSPLKDGVKDEGLYALRSIMDDDEIREFASLPEDQKKEQLEYIAKLICGIRLFNKDSLKGGEGIPDLIQILSINKNCLLVSLEVIVNKLEGKINKLTTVLNNAYRFNCKDGYCTEMKLRPSSLLTDVEFLKDLLVCYRQYQIYCFKLLHILKYDRVRIGKLQYASNYQCIEATCLSRVAVPSSKVFPLLEKHAIIWRSMQYEGIYLLHINKILTMITELVNIPTYPEELIDTCVANLTLKRDFNWRTTKITPPYKTQNYKFTKIKTYREIIEKGEKLTIHGYDIYKLVFANGMLIPGSTEAGVVVYNNNWNFLFSDYRSYTAWYHDFTENILRFLELARNKVFLIELFDLFNALEIIMEHTLHFSPTKKIRVSGITVDVQCEGHIPSFISPTYKWNVWDLRREALLKAKLTHCRTSSTQTGIIYKKWSVPVQTAEQKEKLVVTKTDKSVNTFQKKRFLFGLRGRLDSKFIDIDLTRPIRKTKTCENDDMNKN
ncbi:cilia- and flagella-associated protein 206 isoform X2 [Aethina tumida]|nr:cilia- and flagella-associated protein 206 isoform X2 [Aethina tumida]